MMHKGHLTITKAKMKIRYQHNQVAIKHERLISLPTGSYHAFLLSVDFFQSQLFRKKTIRMSNILDPNQARHFVGPDLGPNYMYLQSLSADGTNRQRVKSLVQS